MRRLLPSAGLCVGLIGPAFADPAITTAWSNMRSAPSAHAHIVQSIPANAQIDLQNCAGNWCHASWRNLASYLPAFAVAQGGPPPGAVAAPPPAVVVHAQVHNHKVHVLLAWDERLQEVVAGREAGKVVRLLKAN